jgi:hypothetical protein
MYRGIGIGDRKRIVVLQHSYILAQQLQRFHRCLWLGAGEQEPSWTRFVQNRLPHSIVVVRLKGRLGPGYLFTLSRVSLNQDLVVTPVATTDFLRVYSFVLQQIDYCIYTSRRR